MILEVVRLVAGQLRTGGYTGQIILCMTQEGFNANTDADLSDMERILRLQTLGARQLLSEGVVDLVIPQHYIWGRLTLGAFDTVGSGVSGPVAAYSSLTHSNSSQPGGANLAWLQRSQGFAAPFNTNSHQSALGTIANALIWGVAFGIDPRGDTTFDTPAGLPTPLANFIRSDGARIYGGHATQGAGLNENGNLPYDTGANPAGPPDSELDLDWNATIRGQMQDIIWHAWQDWLNEETEFDGLDGSMAGSSDGTSSAAGSMTGTANSSGDSDGSSTGAGSMGGTASMDGSSSGAGTGTGSMSGTASMDGNSDGVAGGSGTLDSDAPGAMDGSSASTSDASGSMTGTASMTGSSQGTSSATQTDAAEPVALGLVATTDTTRPAHTRSREGMGQPWYVNPEDEGSTLSELAVYPAVMDDRNRTVETPEAPIDLSSVTAVGLQVWDGSVWADVAGTGGVASEVLTATSEREAGTYWRLSFTPAAGALAALAASVGYESHSRRWSLTVPGGDLHVPSRGYDVLYLNPPPSS